MAYMRSSTSTVRGKKSKCSLGCLPAVVVASSMRVVVEVDDDRAAGLTGHTAGLESDCVGAELAVVDRGVWRYGS